MRKFIAQLKKENRGSTLVLVIVCMFFVSIIGMMILSITMINVDMKTVERKSTENFYDTETVLEELNTTLRQKTIDAYKIAYVKMLQSYVKTLDETTRQDIFFRNVINTLDLTLPYGVMNMTGLNSDILSDIIDDIDLGFSGVLTYDEDGLGIEVDVASSEIIIHGVTLEYDEDGYKTRITTDIVLSVLYPDISLGYSTSIEGLYDSAYVIIANGNVTTSSDGENALGSNLALEGNIYTGKNLIINNRTFTANSDKLVIGSSLLLKTNALLSATISDSDNNGIWARNIELAGGGIILNGDCYVADDLSIDAAGSSFEMTNGDYYGYTFTNVAETDPKSSSSIVINKPNITLDLSGCSKLWIAGNAYINETSAFGSDTTGILEGEAIAYKNMQAAYLVPGGCIVGVGHNPVENSDRFVVAQGTSLESDFLVMSTMSEAERTAAVACTDKNGVSYTVGSVLPAGTILANGTAAPFNISVPVIDMLNNKIGNDYYTDDGYYINVSLNKSGGGIMLERYVDLNDSFTMRTVAASGMTYYYLLFKNATSAAQYYKEFSETTRGQATLNQINNLLSSTIKLPLNSSLISSVGNLITYSGTDSYGLNSGTITNALVLLPVRNSLTQKFNALLMRLNPLDSSMVSGTKVIDAVAEDGYYTDKINMFEVLINQEQLKTDYEGRAPVLKLMATADLVNFYMCAAWDTDIRVSELRYESDASPAEVKNTVIITNKNVIVDRNFTGLIIAGGDVKITTDGASSIKTDAIKLNDLVKDDAVGIYFKAYQGDSQPEGNQLPMDNVIFVNYKNWQKN